MNILDSNSISYILDNNIKLIKEYYITQDVRDEFDVREYITGQKLPDGILLISELGFFDLALYLNYYEEMLNKHGGRSFYNMTGFGDISILSALKNIEESVKKDNKKRLFGIAGDIKVFTEDGALIRKIRKETTSVKILDNKQIK